MEAYSPLARAKKFREPRLLDVARRCSLTPAQVMIRWCLQRGCVVIPKSVTPSRIEENAQLGDAPLSAADMNGVGRARRARHPLGPDAVAITTM